ncbi:hypothetical protein JTE90_018378 [Oedothorax gibbosus]|uniref:Uncharacterized protein n=1 Tax=Oedothorax gibbosus TaxID=931172 RepID=A0AAV6UCK9_9ARAC|nr:hypothetical protein JTE90_018378 [Oedothorax gibbosus]
MCVCSESYIAVPLNEKGNIAIWKTEYPSSKPVILIGHHKSVTALDLSHSPLDHYLCSCSSDNIILWNLLENNGNPTKGKVLHSHMEQPLFCCFSSDNSRIAFSFPNGMWIFDLKENNWFISIEECSFSMFDYNINTNKLLGIDDIYLKSWDLQSNEVSTILNITPGILTALCIDKETEIIAVGTTSGHLNVYGKDYNLLRNIQIWKLLLQQQQNVDSSDEGSTKSYDHDCFPVFSIKILKEKKDSTSFLPQVTYLLIATSTCIFILNINNEVLIFYLDFHESEINFDIGLIRYASIALSSDNSEAYVNVLPLMGESLAFIKLSLKEIISSEEEPIFEHGTCNKFKTDAENKETGLTFLNSSSGMPEKSLLAPKTKCSAKSKAAKKTSSNLNLPVTFHTNVKSSGYGILHKPRNLFQPQTLKTHRVKSGFHLPEKFEKSCSEKEKNILKEYKETTHFQNFQICDKIKSAVSPTGSALQITVDGKYASCATTNGSIDILKLGKEKFKIIHTLNAHKGEVNSAAWSHTDKLLVSSGKDKTVKIWDFEKQKRQPVLSEGVAADSATGTTKSKYIFEEAITQVQFYYLDRFILAAAGNNIYIFEYTINIEKSGIKSSVNKSSIKLFKKFPLNVKRITTLAAMNQFFSNILFLLS